MIYLKKYLKKQHNRQILHLENLVRLLATKQFLYYNRSFYKHYFY